MSFGKTLKNARIKKGLSLRRLGDMVNYPFSVLSEIENGNRNIPAENEALLQALTEVLDIDLAAAREEISVDAYSRKPIRLEQLFRKDENFAATFYRETEKMSDDEIIKMLTEAINKLGKGD
ncbi:MAG: helix-turn-helix domain-containing protein [Deltaproteobacteria bacterium]|nr:helix-turn-helix domain-containing protein [Deltaproteobacteria bacterium]